MSESTSDGILDSSLAVFCRYGFQKTSMLDIARAAGISRATLYLHFKNKEDIFRSGAIRTHTRVLHAVESELTSPLGVLTQIESALTTYFTGLLEEISASPHGLELFDASADLVGDVARESRQKLVGLIAAALCRADESGEIRLAKLDTSVEQLAALTLGVVDGLKHGGAGTLSVRSGVALQMRLLKASSDAGQ